MAWWGGEDYGVAPDLVDQDAWEYRKEAYRKLDQHWRGYSCFKIMDEGSVLPGELPQRIAEDLDEDLRDPNAEIPGDDWLECCPRISDIPKHRRASLKAEANSHEHLLRHKPNKSGNGVQSGDITNAGGETDIVVTFELDVQ